MDTNIYHLRETELELGREIQSNCACNGRNKHCQTERGRLWGTFLTTADPLHWAKCTSSLVLHCTGAQNGTRDDMFPFLGDSPLSLPHISLLGPVLTCLSQWSTGWCWSWQGGPAPLAFTLTPALGPALPVVIMKWHRGLETPDFPHLLRHALQNSWAGGLGAFSRVPRVCRRWRLKPSLGQGILELMSPTP